MTNTHQQDVRGKENDIDRLPEIPHSTMPLLTAPNVSSHSAKKISIFSCIKVNKKIKCFRSFSKKNIFPDMLFCKIHKSLDFSTGSILFSFQTEIQPF